LQLRKWTGFIIYITLFAFFIYSSRVKSNGNDYDGATVGRCFLLIGNRANGLFRFFFVSNHQVTQTRPLLTFRKTHVKADTVPASATRSWFLGVIDKWLCFIVDAHELQSLNVSSFYATLSRCHRNPAIGSEVDVYIH